MMHLSLPLHSSRLSPPHAGIMSAVVPYQTRGAFTYNYKTMFHQLIIQFEPTYIYVVSFYAMCMSQ